MGGLPTRIVLFELVTVRAPSMAVTLLFTLDFLLPLKIKYKEDYEKTKGRALGTTDSKLLHSLQVAKMSSEVNSPSPHPGSKLTVVLLGISSFVLICTHNAFLSGLT